MPYFSGYNYRRIRAELGNTPTSFPELHTLGEMRPHSHTIHLNNVQKQTFVEDVENDKRANLRPSLEVMYHELTHWVDLVGTVWGQNYLLTIYNAYDALVNQREEEFHSLITLFDEDRRIMFPDYYHQTHAEPIPHSVRRPWRIQFSSGLEFSPDGRQEYMRPIFFVRFSDHDTDKLIARQPISVGALLETCATWSELLTGMSVIGTLDTDEALVANQLWSHEKSEILYTKDLTLYTSPAHLVSFSVGTQEAMRTYEYSAILANIALNLTNEHFDRLRHPEMFYPFGEERLNAFVNSRNRGYGFAAIVTNAPRTNEEQTALEWIEEALAASNLPSYTDLLNESKAHLNQINESAPMRNELDNIRNYMFEIGLDFFDYRTEHRSPVITAEIGRRDGLLLPPAFDMDGELMGLGPHHLDHNRYDPEFMYNMEIELYKYTQNFLVGCRGFKT